MQKKEIAGTPEGPTTIEDVIVDINGLPMGEVFTTGFLCYTDEASREAQKMSGSVVRLIGRVEGKYPQCSMEIRLEKWQNGGRNGRSLILELTSGGRTVGHVGLAFLQEGSSWAPERPDFNMYGDDIRDPRVDKCFEIMRELGKLLTPTTE